MTDFYVARLKEDLHDNRYEHIKRCPQRGCQQVLYAVPELGVHQWVHYELPRKVIHNIVQARCPFHLLSLENKMKKT